MEETTNTKTSEYRKCRVTVYGIVQGVGFRPFVSRIAMADHILGSVANRGSYVEIFAQALPEDMEVFLKDLEEKAPERSAILKVDVADLDFPDYADFEIIESEKEAGDIFVSPDIATCEKCKAELYDKNNRRYMHPFINCTACGPRLTILDAMPYDRERTSMKEFPMCPECASEYYDPETRRYDAQPVCCNHCGPEVYLVGKEKEPWGRGSRAISYVRQAIMDGQIIAIKGIGGFHLCCDATNEEAVARLRVLKRRPAKPFAVMMRDLDAAKRYCQVDAEQEKILDGHQKPIILLPRKANTECSGGSEQQMQSAASGNPKELAPSVAPGNPKVGVMLPYAPVQMLLFDYNDDLTMTTDCFVMTSGNVSGAPICRTDEDAVKELSGFCDLILSHNRKIRLRADDSVMDFYQGKPYMIRRSRGYAPLPTMMSAPLAGHVLGIGGELKNTFCIAKNQLLYPSPYVGDMADLRTVRALEESIVRMEELLEAKPELVVCDLHPRYNTTLVAEQQNLPLLKIQHHYAHVLSCMAENDVPENEKVIGVSFDGTGYGTDGTIWGGEILISDYYGFERVASIKPFLQVGGDLSSKEGWRIAASMLGSIYGPDEAGKLVEELGICKASEQKLIGTMGQKNINTVVSTSAGRLFDGVSAILGIRRKSTFEGEASTSLQFAAEAKKYEDHPAENVVRDHPEFLEPEIAEDGRELLRTDLLVKYITEEKRRGEDPDKLAYLFHAILAMQIVESVKRISRKTGIQSTALTGGVFQNQLLLRICDEKLSQLKVYRHSLIPPNDGGLALGQAIAGMYYLKK